MFYSIENTDGEVLFYYKQKRMEQGYRDNIHCYDEMKFVRIVDGGGVWRIGGTDYRVSKGDILIMSRADIRQVQSVEESPLIIEQADFVPAFLAPMQDVALFFIHRPDGFKNLLPSDSGLQQRMDGLVDEIKENRPFKQQAVRSKLCELVIATARLLNAVPSENGRTLSRQSTVEDAKSYIRKHFAEKITLERVAAEFFLSPAYFSRLFRFHSGMAFQEYLAQVRVKELLSLIDSEPINILDAALQCGFSSSSGFYRTFRHVTGSTPKAFKNQSY